MALIIDGDELDMSPEFWVRFANWWGDKAYREAGMAQELELTARECAADAIWDKFKWVDDLGYTQAVSDICEFLREAPKSSDLLVWTGGELVNEEEEEYDDD